MSRGEGTPLERVRRWIAAAWTGWGWTHTAAVAFLPLLTMLYMGAFLVAADGTRYAAFVVHTWLAHAFIFALPLVFLVSMADHAVDDGCSGIAAYGAAVVAAEVVGELVIARLVAAPMQPLLMWSLSMSSASQIQWGLFEVLWETLRLFVPLTLGVAAYAQWRGQQRALARLHAGELARARQQHDLASARLLALQARVEPALLFGTLARVDALIGRSVPAADALLNDLIELLRALTPATGASASTVEREFAIVRAFGRVAADPQLQPPSLELEAEPGTAAAGLAPLVLLPMLRALVAVSSPWRVRATHASGRLRLEFVPRSPGDRDAGMIASGSIDLASLQDRLTLVHGESAMVRAVVGDEPGLFIDVPYRHDQGADR